MLKQEQFHEQNNCSATTKCATIVKKHLITPHPLL